MKKYKKEIITTLGIVLGIIVLNVIISTTTGVNVLSNTINYITNKKSPNEIKSISLTSDGYNDNTGGSYDIKKSAEWTGTDTAQINFDVDTKTKRNNNPKDVILVLDTSGSMSGSRISSVKKDTIEFVSNSFNNNENKVSLITFDSNATTLLDWTNNSEDLVSKINSISNDLSSYALTNYYQALIEVDKMLQSYEPQKGRDLIVFFLTDGIPCMETPNEINQYKILKEKYPYIIINGIQYEMGNYVREELYNVSDNQFIADSYNLQSIMNDAIYNVETYEKFELVDYIDNDYFYVESVDDIKVSRGKVELTEENGVQKVIWKIDPNEFRTGSKANMTINLKLKQRYVGNEGYYPTNKKFEVITKLPDEKEVTRETNETPILKSGYKVYYDTNAPTGCDLDNFEETHYSFENVKISDKITCEGYQFKGWKIIDDVKILNDDYFIMPSKDVTLKAVWTGHDITKSMDGTIYVVPSIMKNYSQYSTDDYHNSKYKSKVTKIVTKDNTNIPVTAIESWDVSQDGNGSVIAYIEDDETGNGTYKVTIGGKGKVFANEDSSYLFYNFSNLKEIDLTKLDTSNVTNMRSMFLGCYTLISLNISNFDTHNVTDMDSMFDGCNNLINLDVSSFDTSNVTNMRYMFWDCFNLKTLDVSNFNTSKVTNMLFMFYGCNKLNVIDVSNFNTSKVTNMYYMFGNCNNLTNLDLSNFDISKVTDMRGMFNWCSNLTTTININGKPSKYAGIFQGAATSEGAEITVNYTSDNESLVDALIATKSTNSHIVKGSLITN